MQSVSSKWPNMLCGKITASVLNGAARYIMAGSLFENIMLAALKAVLLGKRLEAAVLAKVGSTCSFCNFSFTKWIDNNNIERVEYCYDYGLENCEISGLTPFISDTCIKGTKSKHN